MDGYSSSDTDISLDSLEKGLKKESVKKNASEENVDTILVPFYEKDVLIKVPKGKKSKDAHEIKKESSPIKNYLVNKEVHKPKRTYLEIFRKQFVPTNNNSRKGVSEIRSVSPEFGDTERESFGEESSNPVADFFNTESYNEIYYEKLINQELTSYLEHSLEEQLRLSGELRSKSPNDVDENNLKSVSDVSQPRRHLRRATVQPVQNVKLGGLGPDMENIKPRLERARSLQRYSERVRMENRVKIYKKSIQEDTDKKADKELTAKQKDTLKKKELKENEKSYLVNKNVQDKQSQNIRKIYQSKSKSANVQRMRERDEIKQKVNVQSNINNTQRVDNNKQRQREVGGEERVKSCNRYMPQKPNKDLDIKHIKDEVSEPPVHISFLVNMGGMRPSSALKKLEAKHRMYQERVKEFNFNNNNGKDNN